MPRRTQPTRTTLRLETLDSRDVPSVVAADTGAVTPPVASETPAQTADSSDEAIGTIELAPRVVKDDLLAAPRGRYAVATGAGVTAQVSVYDAVTNAKLGTLTPFAGDFTGGARVATGDVTGDRVDDIVVAQGPGGGSWVKVYDGVTLELVRAFQAYASSFAGGVSVATGDVDGDGHADVITGAGPGGGPHVQVFSGQSGAVEQSFFAYAPTFTGGINVAAGDVDGDGRADVITGAGPGGGPHVQVFSGRDHAVLSSFFAYSPSFTGGVNVAAGDTTGSGTARIATAPMAGGAPEVRLFDGATPVATLAPFDMTQRGGATVALQDVNNDGRADVIVGSGSGVPPAAVVLDAATGDTLQDVSAPVAGDSGGLFVG